MATAGQRGPAAFAIMLRRLLAADGASIGVRPMLATAYAANALSVSVPLAGPELATAFTFRRFGRQGADGPLAGWTLLVGGAFGDPEEWRFDWDRPYTRDEWLEQVPTFGGHSQIPPAKLQELLTGIGAAIDAVGCSFTAHYTTVAVTAATARWSA